MKQSDNFSLKSKYPFITNECIISFEKQVNNKTKYYIDISESLEVAYKLEHPEYSQASLYKEALNIVRQLDYNSIVHLKITS